MRRSDVKNIPRPYPEGLHFEAPRQDKIPLKLITSPGRVTILHSLFSLLNHIDPSGFPNKLCDQDLVVVLSLIQNLQVLS